jgi:lipoprotein-releasing system permease protein
LYKYVIALRYLLTKRILLFSLAAVTLGVFAIIVVLGILTGFSKHLKGRIRGNLSDIIVEGGGVKGFDRYQEILSRLEQIENVAALSPHLEGLAILQARLGTGELSAEYPCQFVGLIPEKEVAVNNFREFVADDDSPDFSLDGFDTGYPGAIIGAELLAAPGIHLYGDVALTTPVTFDDYNTEFFTVIKEFRSGMYEYDSGRFYISLEAAQNLKKDDSRITSIYIKLKDPRRAADTKTQIIGALAPYDEFDVSTWKEKRQAFIRIIDMERRITAVILFFFLLVAGFSIIAIMTNIIMSKKGDIGILRAIGGSRKGLLTLFLLYGLLIGIIGSSIGAGLGGLFLEKLDGIEQFVYYFTRLTPYPRKGILDDEFHAKYGGFLRGVDRVVLYVTGFAFASLHEKPVQDVYYMKSIPRDINYNRIISIAVLGAALSLAASVYPSYRAARLDPIRAIREAT